MEFLRFVTGSASFVAHGVLREEASSLPYHAHWAVLVCRQWNSLNKSVGSLGHLAWKDNVDMMLGGVRKCWVFKVLKFVFDAKIIDNDPTSISSRDRDIVLSLVLDEKKMRSVIDELYAARWSNIVGNPRTCPSNGATFCRYISWFGLSGNVTCSN